MIPISELPKHSHHLVSEVDNFNKQFVDFAAHHSQIRRLALQIGDGIWYTVKPKLEYAIAATEHKFGADMADGWIATLTVNGWLYHRGGISD